MFKWLRRLYHWTMSYADKSYASVALSIVAFIEASFFLIPPEALFLPMATARPKRAFFYAFLMTSFSVLGALFGYWLGTTFWDYLSPYFFKYIFSVEQFDFVKLQFNQNTFWTIFVAGFTPIPYKVFTIAAGVVSAPMGAFVISSILSRGLRYFLLAALLFFFGPSIRTWIDRNFEKATIFITLLIFVLILILKIL